MLKKEIGLKIQKLRKKASISLDVLAELWNVSEDVAAKIEEGFICATIDQLEIVAMAGCVNLNYFFESIDVLNEYLAMFSNELDKSDLIRLKKLIANLNDNINVLN